MIISVAVAAVAAAPSTNSKTAINSYDKLLASKPSSIGSHLTVRQIMRSSHKAVQPAPFKLSSSIWPDIINN